MPTNGIHTAVLATVTLLCSALACRAATDLVLPPTPSPSPIPAAPSSTSIATKTADACSDLPSQVLEAAGNNPETGGLDAAMDTDKEPIFLVTYTVRANRILDPEFESVPAEFTDEQDDTAAHQRTWDYFTALIPAGERTMLDGYILFTDGPESILGAVGRFREPDRWALELDIADTADAYSLTYTLLHEFGHLLTLNAEQVPPSLATFNFPEDQGRFDREAAACPQYFPGEGCSKPDSYINLFYDQFWTGIYDEWLKIDDEQDEEEYVEQLEDFYDKYEADFVSDYAVTSPGEDIAETWTYFVLTPKPAGDMLAHQKVLFFYGYPRLVRLRGRILENLCQAFPGQ